MTGRQPKAPTRSSHGADPANDAALIVVGLAATVGLLALVRTITARPGVGLAAAAGLAVLGFGVLRARARILDMVAGRRDPAGPGLIVGTVRGDWLLARRRRFVVPWSAFTRHVLIDGPTGRGKTFTFIDPILRAHLARPNTGVLYLDGKGDRIDQPTGGRAGVAFDALFIPEDPGRSVCWNPLAGPDPVAAVATFAAALVPEAASAAANFYEARGAHVVRRVGAAMLLTGVGLPGWPQGEDETVARMRSSGLRTPVADKLLLKYGEYECARQLWLLPTREHGDLVKLISRRAQPPDNQPDRPGLTIEGLFRFLFAGGDLQRLARGCAASAAAAGDPVLSRTLGQLEADITGLAGLAPREWAATLANLQNRLGPFLAPPFLELCSTDGIRVEHVCAGRSLGFLLPTGRYPGVAEALGRLVLAQFRQAVLASDPQVTKVAVLDEFHNFVSGDWVAFLNQARSRGGSAVMAVQTIAAFDEEVRDAMLANVATVMVTPGCQPLDAEHWSRAFGEISSSRASFSYEPRSPLDPPRRPSVRVEEIDRPRFTPTGISELDQELAIIRTVAGRRAYPPAKVRVQRGP